MTMNPTELKGALEAIIYAADEPATLDQIAAAIGEEKHIIRAALDEMISTYAVEDRGIEIRGVNVSGVIKTLLEKRLITTAGRKAVMGRPILYRTSKEFLMRFGLSDLDELPSLKEFEQLARAALGSDEGIAPIEPEAAPETSDTLDTTETSKAVPNTAVTETSGDAA